MLAVTCLQLRLENSRDNTGKSSLAVQFVDGHFVESYYPTIENTFSKIIKYKGQEFSTEIIDTAGQVSLPNGP
jgi:GTPase SAR1 family protein